MDHFCFVLKVRVRDDQDPTLKVGWLADCLGLEADKIDWDRTLEVDQLGNWLVSVPQMSIEAGRKS